MASTSPRISVITPVYRCEQTLQRALDSLMVQDERRWEAVIVDDGSPDRSWKVAEGFAYFDSRFRVLRQANAGACAARNAGIAEAQGQFVLFLDADDWLEPNALSSMAGACDRNKWDAAHGYFRYTTADGVPTGWTGGGPDASRSLFEALAGSNVLAMPSSIMLRRGVLDDVGGFDPTLTHCGDWDLWARVARRKGATGRVDTCVANYRMRPTSLSRRPHSLLRDALTTLKRIHSADPRVKNPASEYANGAGQDSLPLSAARFSLYAIGLLIGAGEFDAAPALLEQIAPWPAMSAVDAAGFLFYSICFARCVGPESAAGFWPEVAAAVDSLLVAIEAKAGVPGMAQEIAAAMNGFSAAEEDPLPRPLEQEPAGLLSRTG